VLLDAMGDLPAEVRLWIAGDGPETVELRRRVAGDMRIEWLGRLSEADKIERLRSATVFCAPSLRGESFGVVLLEAMAARTAVVATQLPGYANVARAGTDALLVTPGDPRALAAALHRALFEPELNAGLVASGAERATGFSMEELAGRYEGLYERVLGRR
jgi:phosphatidylinositol alpha-mannosyltransferase